jgi:putative intracellular protease/amidase
MPAAPTWQGLKESPMSRVVHLYVFDGYADWEPAFAVAGINNPQFQREPGRWSVRTVAVRRGQAVRSMGGVAVMPDLGLADLRPDDSGLLILPGGRGWEDDGAHDAAVERALRWLDDGRPVAAICGATAGLARAGRLDDRPHTSNAASYLKGTGYGGAAHYRDEPVVDDDGLITAGGMAPVEFAGAVFERLGLYDPEVLAAWMQLYKTGRSEYFARMGRAAAQAHPA